VFLKSLRPTRARRRRRDDQFCVITALKTFRSVPAGQARLDGNAHLARLKRSKWNFFDPHIFFAVKDCCFHGKTLPDLTLGASVRELESKSHLVAGATTSTFPEASTEISRAPCWIFEIVSLPPGQRTESWAGDWLALNTCTALSCDQ